MDSMSRKNKGFAPLAGILIVFLIGLGVYTLIGKTGKIEQGTFEWCVKKGGNVVMYGPNSRKRCVTDFEKTPKVYTEGCLENSKYLVTYNDASDPNELTTLVKYKNGNQNPVCEHKADEGDLEIKNEHAEGFFGLAGNFIIFDSGCCPHPRGLIIYDIEKKERVFRDRYMEPIEINEDNVLYWSPMDTMATRANCHEYDEYTNEGFGAIIARYVRLNLSDLSLTDLDQKRCSITQ